MALQLMRVPSCSLRSIIKENQAVSTFSLRAVGEKIPQSLLALYCGELNQHLNIQGPAAVHVDQAVDHRHISRQLRPADFISERRSRRAPKNFYSVDEPQLLSS